MRDSADLCPRGFFLNAERSGGGMRMSIGGVVAVSELSDERMILVTHGARVELTGRGLSLTVYEGRTAEVVGRIREMRLLYGKD